MSCVHVYVYVHSTHENNMKSSWLVYSLYVRTYIRTVWRKCLTVQNFDEWSSQGF